MAINYAEKYSDRVAERFKTGSLTNSAVNQDYSFLGARTVRVYTIGTVPLNNYSATGANRYGTPVELPDMVQEMVLSQDKGFAMTIDKGNNLDQMLTKNAGKALRRQIDEVVIPYIDGYRLKRMCEQAGSIVPMAEPAVSTVVAAVLAAGERLDESLVPRTDRTLFIGTKYYTLLKGSGEFLGLEKLGEKALAKGIVGEIDGAKVVPVASSRMPADCFFILAHRDSTTSPVKLDEYKVHENPPGISGALVEGRLYFDAFVLNAKKMGVYAAVLTGSAAAQPTANPASGATVTPGTTTVALSSATGGASIFYTVDGSDPRFSDTRAAYSGAIPTTGWADGTVLKAYAAKAGLYDSGVLSASYKV